MTLLTTLLDDHELALLAKLRDHVDAHQHMSLQDFLVEELQIGRASILNVQSPEFKGLTLWQ